MCYCLHKMEHLYQTIVQDVLLLSTQVVVYVFATVDSQKGRKSLWQSVNVKYIFGSLAHPMVSSGQVFACVRFLGRLRYVTALARPKESVPSHQGIGTRCCGAFRAISPSS